MESFERVLAVNLRGVFLGLKYGIPAMIASGGGSVINIASIAGLVAFQGTSPYTASKAGVLGLTRVAAAEYGPLGVRVNAICPGVIDTPMLKELAHIDPSMHARIVAHGETMAAVKRLGQTQDTAALAVFLASPEASFITGSVIPADGGYMVE